MDIKKLYQAWELRAKLKLTLNFQLSVKAEQHYVLVEKQAIQGEFIHMFHIMQLCLCENVAVARLC